MNYQECPHYLEMLDILTNGKDLQDISFEIENTVGCKECVGTICSLWLNLFFVHDMRPQLNIEEAKLTIQNIDEEMKKIANQLVRNLAKKK